MELNTQQISAENRSVESMMLTWPECFYKEKEAETRFALLEEAQRQELTPEEKEIKLEKPAMTIPSYDEVADSNIELTLDSEPAETEQTDNVQ